MTNNRPLKERVLYFISQQPGYRSHEEEHLSVKDSNGSWSILYGDSIQVGIMGTGASQDEAFDDFIKKWNAFKGFEWIDKSKMISKL
ncbi:MAG TPA: hypothetical protein VMY77_06260 [Chitinophagaceae bacterium]|nr:hypothetical protein [Chitinophagaceae bacterium]